MHCAAFTDPNITSFNHWIDTAGTFHSRALSNFSPIGLNKYQLINAILINQIIRVLGMSYLFELQLKYYVIYVTQDEITKSRINQPLDQINGQSIQYLISSIKNSMNLQLP